VKSSITKTFTVSEVTKLINPPTDPDFSVQLPSRIRQEKRKDGGENWGWGGGVQTLFFAFFVVIPGDQGSWAKKESAGMHPGGFLGGNIYILLE